MRRLATAMLASGAVLMATATPAFAHAELTASTPAQNASPARIELTFTEPVSLPTAAVAPATTTSTTTTTTPAPTSTEPSRTSPAASDGGTLLWVWLLAGAVLLAALVFVTLRVRRPGR